VTRPLTLFATLALALLGCSAGAGPDLGAPPSPPFCPDGQIGGCAGDEPPIQVEGAPDAGPGGAPVQWNGGQVLPLDDGLGAPCASGVAGGAGALAVVITSLLRWRW
jgi:hypothetical protein